MLSRTAVAGPKPEARVSAVVRRPGEESLGTRSLRLLLASLGRVSLRLDISLARSAASLLPTLIGTHLSILSVKYTSCANNSVCVMASDTIGVYPPPQYTYDRGQLIRSREEKERKEGRNGERTVCASRSNTFIPCTSVISLKR